MSPQQDKVGGRNLDIGYLIDEGPLRIPLPIMKKHFVCFGASGSGKTVLGKNILEELTRNGVPSIIVDPQGDLASLGLLGEETSLAAHGVDLEHAKEFANKAEVRIFTPASSKGIPLRVDLFRMPDKDLPMEERVNAFDMTASSIVQLLDYDHNSSKGKAARKFLYILLKYADDNGMRLYDIDELMGLARDTARIGLKAQGIIKKKDLESLYIDLGHLTIGVEDLLFTHGVGMDMDNFLTPITKGGVPVNIIYLNTLNTDRHKHFFVANLCKEIYSWMLKNPSKDVQLAFYIDEVGPFMPPYPRNPPAKQLLKMLFKQGRKYGVSMMMCTQNIADIEYKALAQASTWALGRLMAAQDLGNVRHLLKSLPPTEYERVLRSLPGLETCHFSLISSDVFKGPVMMRSRWLYTRHETLDEDAIKAAMRPDVVDHFEDPLKMAPGEDIKPFVPVAPSGTQSDHEEGTGPWPVTDDDPLVKGPILDESSEDPDKGYKKRFVLLADVHVPQAQASKRLMEMADELLNETEDVVKVDTEYLILWRVRVQVEVKEGMIPFLAKKVTHEENIYIEGSRNLPTSGKLMNVERTMRFSNVTSKKAHEIVDLDHNTEFSVLELSELPFDIKKVPQLSEKEVERIVYNLFGLRVLKAKRVILRVWRFMVKDKRTHKMRFVRLDSVFGKPISML